jgi:pterin-4a-carbinolamine dehydratase
MPSFGKFSNDDRTVHLGIKNRHPNDILRTLAHEMVHYAQGEHGELDADSWHTGSPEEDQANAEAGVIMREFNQQFPQYMELKPIVVEKWSKKYKKSINCSNPKGFSQKAHCAGRKKHTSEQLDENQEKYIIYLNDKPVSTYPTNREAEYQAKMVAQKFPTAKIDIKKEVCTLSPVQLEENLRDWFKKDKWVRMDTKGKIKGPCAREPGEGKPKCLPQAKAYALGKKGRAAAAQKKRREDPNPNRRGPAKNVATKVREQATRRDPKDLTAPSDQELDKLHHKFIPTWSMLDHDLLATAYDFQDDDTALSYVNQLDDVEQSMDHNAVITIDNARVSIKVRTGDIDGLSRLDFEFALRANDLAKQLQADQLPHATNAINEQQFDENCWKGYHKEGNKKMFGKTVPNCVKNESLEYYITNSICPECQGHMVAESQINEKQDACYHKVKSRYKVWPSAYASGALVQCRKKGAANWGNKSKSVKENFADGEIKESKETRQALSDQHFEFPQQGQYGYRTGYQGRGVLELADGRTGKIINLGEFGDFDDEYKPNQKWLRIVFTNPNMDDNAWNELEDMLWSDDQVAENFADGKGPGKPGDSQRHGIPKGATMAELEKAANAPGRKGQLARWQINMRRGKKK